MILSKNFFSTSSSTEYSNIVVKFEYKWRTMLASKKLNNIMSVLLQYTLKQTSRLCNQFIVNNYKEFSEKIF